MVKRKLLSHVKINSDYVSHSISEHSSCSVNKRLRLKCGKNQLLYNTDMGNKPAIRTPLYNQIEIRNKFTALSLLEDQVSTSPDNPTSNSIRVSRNSSNVCKHKQSVKHKNRQSPLGNDSIYLPDRLLVNKQPRNICSDTLSKIHDVNTNIRRASVQNNPKTQNKTTLPVIPKKDQLTLCFWNGQAIKEKTCTINDFRLEHDIDIYMIVETWLSDTNHTKTITELKDNTCNFINYPRPYAGKGGGIGCIYKNN